MRFPTIVECEKWISLQTPSTPLNGTLDSTGLIDNTGFNQDSFANVTLKPEIELNPHLFQFPNCFVRYLWLTLYSVFCVEIASKTTSYCIFCYSKSTMKILDLVGTILEEATRSPRQGASPQSYLGTTKSIFELYIAVVPNIHKKFLDSIPQQVGMFWYFPDRKSSHLWMW